MHVDMPVKQQGERLESGLGFASRLSRELHENVPRVHFLSAVQRPRVLEHDVHDLILAQLDDMRACLRRCGQIEVAERLVEVEPVRDAALLNPMLRLLAKTKLHGVQQRGGALGERDVVDRPQQRPVRLLVLRAEDGELPSRRREVHGEARLKAPHVAQRPFDVIALWGAPRRAHRQGRVGVRCGIAQNGQPFLVAAPVADRRADPEKACICVCVHVCMRAARMESREVRSCRRGSRSFCAAETRPTYRYYF